MVQAPDSNGFNRKAATELLKIAKGLLSWRPRSVYRDDPRWIKAKYPGTAKDGTPFRKGDKILYWPRTKTIMVGKVAEQAWREFESQAADEYVYQSY